MIRRCFLFIALVAALSSLQAAPSPYDWISKPCPPLRLDYLGGFPELKGKVLVLQFWTSTEPGSAQEARLLDDLHLRYHDQGLEVISIGSEEDVLISEFRKKGGYKHRFARDARGALRSQFAITSTVWTVIVDRTGTVAWTGRLQDFSHQALKTALDGTETQTVAPLKPQPTDFLIRPAGLPKAS